MPSYAMEYAASIVKAHIATNQMTPTEVVAFIRDLHRAIVESDPSTAQEISQTASSPQRASNQWSTADNSTELLADAPTTGSASSGGFDANAWLASLPNPTMFAQAEAIANNSSNLARGWVGVYDSHLVCLIDGKPLRVLKTHLKRNYSDDPRLSTFEAYKAHFRLPPDYPSVAHDFHELKAERIRKSHAKRKRGTARHSAELSKKINAAIAKAGLDPDDQLKPDTLPGVFAHTIVCIECGATTDGIADHFADQHPVISISKYLKSINASSRYPRTLPAINPKRKSR